MRDGKLLLRLADEAERSGDYNSAWRYCAEVANSVRCARRVDVLERLRHLEIKASQSQLDFAKIETPVGT